MKIEINNKNPHNICTWDDNADCTRCNVHGQLLCKWDRKILLGFYAINFPSLIMAVWGMIVVGILTGVWWILIAYAVYVLLMLGFIETRFLCSHCPYYAENSSILHCLANHGDPKIWRYRPGPMNRLEKFMMIFLVVAIIFIIGPLSAEGYGLWFIINNYAEYGQGTLLGLIGIAIGSVATGIASIILLRTFYCSRCVNFSCPLNTVPKSIIDEYLKRNNDMRKAWEEAGWILE